jgi:hypothetical protein
MAGPKDVSERDARPLRTWLRRRSALLAEPRSTSDSSRHAGGPGRRRVGQHLRAARSFWALLPAPRGLGRRVPLVRRAFACESRACSWPFFATAFLDAEPRAAAHARTRAAPRCPWPCTCSSMSQPPPRPPPPRLALLAGRPGSRARRWSAARSSTSKRRTRVDARRVRTGPPAVGRKDDGAALSGGGGCRRLVAGPPLYNSRGRSRHAPLERRSADRRAQGRWRTPSRAIRTGLSTGSIDRVRQSCSSMPTRFSTTAARSSSSCRGATAPRTLEDHRPWPFPPGCASIQIVLVATTASKDDHRRQSPSASGLTVVPSSDRFAGSAGAASRRCFKHRVAAGPAPTTSSSLHSGQSVRPALRAGRCFRPRRASPAMPSVIGSRFLPPRRAPGGWLARGGRFVKQPRP